MIWSWPPNKNEKIHLLLSIFQLMVICQRQHHDWHHRHPQRHHRRHQCHQEHQEQQPMPHSNPLHNQIQLRNLQNLNFSQTRTQHRITQIKNRAQTEKLKIRKFPKKKKHTSTASLLMVKVFFQGHFQVTQITWVNIQFLFMVFYIFILGSLHPSIQDYHGKPRRDPQTILQILRDLLSATNQQQFIPQVRMSHGETVTESQTVRVDMRHTVPLNNVVNQTTIYTKMHLSHVKIAQSTSLIYG